MFSSGNSLTYFKQKK